MACVPAADRAKQSRAAIEELARRIDRLTPCWHNPARFFEARDEIRSDLEALARVPPGNERIRVGNAHDFTRLKPLK